MAILTISREYGSGGEEIGMSVAKHMGYEYVDKDRIVKDMRSTGGRWEKVYKDFDEVRPHLWERYDWEYQGFTALIEAKIFGEAIVLRGVVHKPKEYHSIEEIDKKIAGHLPVRNELHYRK
jgi:hypothetical protein